MKHHSWSMAKLRVIWLSDDLSKICWGCPKISPRKEKGYILVSKICDVLSTGKVRCFKVKCEPERMKNIFSIVTKKRTLVLEAANSQCKDLWIKMFASLVVWQKTQP